MSGLSATDAKVVARRWFPSRRERVYRAFTDPEHLARWFSPGEDVATAVVRFELRVGGAYRLAFHFPDGRTDYVVGEYLEIDRDERLVYTWTWEPPDPFAGIETLVTVELMDDGEGTTVVVTHDRFPDADRRAIHDTGWQATLARLAAWLH